MADAARPSIAVVGAAGFVGRRLLGALQEAGMPAVAVVRNPPALAIDGTFHTPLWLGHESTIPRCDAVVNLAYPATGSPVTYSRQNDDIVSTVDQLLAGGGRVIHVSTQAVFGLALDRPVTAGPVASARDEPYVEAKIEIEKQFEQKYRALDVVRLGNVWGPASGAWALPLVQRLVTGRPVAVSGLRGFSNATDVANTASYLVHLLSSAPPDGPRFHHLAELSSTRWDTFTDGLATTLNVEPVSADPDVLQAAAALGDELARALAPLRLRSVYKALASERTAGSWLRSLMRTLPSGTFERLRGDRLVFAGARAPDRAEQTFLAVMSTQREFRTHVIPGWTPPVGESASLQRVIDWIQAG